MEEKETYVAKSLPWKIIAVDFDGTLCENRWPEIGEPNWEVINYLINQKKQGAKLILWTCRTGQKLVDAYWWAHLHGLYFDALNRNISEAIDYFGEDTRKVYAHEYIDDFMCTKFQLPYCSKK